MSQFKWWRQWRGGYWVFSWFIAWQKVSADDYQMTWKHRLGTPAWTFENYVD